jgi:hypothetical protein
MNHMQEIRNSYKISVGNPEEKRPHKESAIQKRTILN